MTREDIIRMAREAGAMFDHMTWVERDLAPVFERFAALMAAHEREKVARWMMERGYATGHGDTIQDLIKEVEWQVAELENEACAKVCEALSGREYQTGKVDHNERAWTDFCAAAIRARGKQ